MYRIMLDPGHGGTDPGAVSPNGWPEKEHTLDVALRILAMEKGFGGKLQFASTRYDDTFVSLKTRAELANRWNADYFISLHMNSDAGRRGRGIEVYALAPGGKGEQLAKVLGEALVYHVGLPFHGQSPKFSSFQVLRETRMPAALCECGFIGTQEEAILITKPTAKQNMAMAICFGLSQFLGIPFSNPDTPSNTSKHPILGQSVITPFQAQSFLRKNNPQAPDYVDLYVKVGELLGVRWDFLFAQSLHETGFWRFGGTVKAGQNNFGGLGATQGSTGAIFPDPYTGILAQGQHAYAYATPLPLPAGMAVVDPRFSLVTRGSAPYIEDLDGRWAVPGQGYSQSILGLIDKMKEMPPQAPPSSPSALDPGAGTVPTIEALIVFLTALAQGLQVNLDEAIEKLKKMLPE